MKTATTIVAAVIMALAVPLTAQPVAIVGGTVEVGDGTRIERGTVLIDGPLITKVGARVDLAPGTRTIDATGKVVWPGMIDPFTTLGLVEVSLDRSTNDADEATLTSTAQLRAIDGINATSEPIAVTRIGGVTTALVQPGTRNPINGQAAIIDLGGRTAEELAVRDVAGIVFNFSSIRDDSYPSTKPGTVAFIRQELYDARAYAARASASDDEAGEQEPSKAARTDLEKDALQRVLSRELPMIAVAPTSSDILNALAVAKEFDLRLVLAAAREAWRVLPEIKAAGVSLLLGETFDLPGERDPYDRYYRLAATLQGAGIPFAFTTADNHNVRQLPEHAAMAVTFGLPEREAVRALAFNAARILGIERSHGMLAAGMTADVVIWDGDPLQIRSRPQRVFVRGLEVPLRSRQEALRDAFSDLTAVY